jgi:hypothetical protein
MRRVLDALKNAKQRWLFVGEILKIFQFVLLNSFYLHIE